MITIERPGRFFFMTNFLRAVRLLGASVSLLLSSAACSKDDQSLGTNNLASASGGNGGTAGNANAGGSAGAAGSPAIEPPSRRICDGSDGLTLGHSARGGGFIESLESVYHEAGFGSFYVDGHCGFWIINSGPIDARWAAAKTGKLTETEERQLATDLGYVGWAGLSGNLCGPTASDQGATFVFDRSNAIACAGTFLASTPDAVRSAFTHDSAWAKRLLEKGADLTGPIRMRSTRSNAIGWKSHPRALSFSLASIAIDPSGYHFGDTPLITLPEDVPALRNLRALVLADLSSIASRFEVVGTDGLRYRVAFRDALPIVNEHGLVPIPGAPSGR